ncbi:MAG: putative Histidine kinase [Promethearchaeota archaeon]|nr:MAG: putative Histidine kinase [Candidatus Lokiarchaeota archaeon]
MSKRNHKLQRSMENKQEYQGTLDTEKFKLIADQSNNGIAIADLKGNIEYINKYFAEIHGYTPQELIGKNLSVFHTKEQMKYVNRINKELLSSGSYSSKEVWHISKDGTPFLMLMNSVVIYNRQNEPKFMATTAINITELRKTQEKYKNLFKTSRDAIMILEPPEWKFTTGNPAAISMFRAKNEKDFCSRAPWEYSPQMQPNNTPSKEKALKIIEEALKKGSLLFEWAHKRLNGELFPATVLLSRMDMGGKSVLQATVRDITEQKRAEQLKLQNMELKRLDKKKNDFITMAAHELKTPLVSISGYADYILTAYRDELSPEVVEDFKIMKRNIKRLGNYMNALLDVMKIDESKMKLQKNPINLNELIKKSIEELSYLIEEKKHTIKLYLQEDLIVDIDYGRIFQVITNLLSNSIKFTPPKGLITITTEKNASHIKFKIEDNGVGIKPENLGTIFDKFETSEMNINKYPEGKGTGLGLYICKGIIEAHGGTIEVTSEGKGKGATFKFFLPNTQ